MRARVLAIHRLCWGEKTQARRDLLNEASQLASGTITAERVDQHYADSYTFVASALLAEVI
jgi:hypothetical protein